MWAQFGIKYQHHIYQEGKICTFDQLRDQFGIPRTWRFRYAQMHHASVAQFGGGEVHVQNTSLETTLLDPDTAKRISRYYQAVGPGDHGLIGRARSRWIAFAPELSDELWQEVLDTF